VSRRVTLVLVDGAGAPLGALPPFDVEVPYWQEVAEVVAGARERHGVDVSVLRVLGGERPTPVGGAVTYLAEALSPPPPVLSTVDGLDRSDHPDRAAYARPGGPAASLRWAAEVLAASGRGPVTAAVQRRTWNLSAIWRLDVPGGCVWLKQVPPFFAHEPAVLRWIDATVRAGLVPPVLAGGGGRMLLDHVPGADLYGAGADACAAIAVEMHRIQLVAAPRVPELLDAGVPDLRAGPLYRAVTGVAARYGDARLHDLVSGLGARLAEVAACGVPDTLVHGDLYPGNVRGDGGTLVLIDWGDSFVGHPAFDLLRLAGELQPVEARALVDAWAARWRAAVPGCDPHRAVDLLRPVAALRNAYVYAHFLANIEPAEHVYHAADVPYWLSQAVTP
jgi:hypothetical protein